MTNQAIDLNVPHILSISNVNHTEYYNVQTSPIRHLYIRIEILNEEDKTMGEVSGTAIDGGYNISADSIIRRTCDLTFNLEQRYLPTDNNSMFWINKRFHLYIGLKDIKQDKTYWFFVPR